MSEDELLIQWFQKRYKVERGLAYDCIKFGPGWWVLKAMLESIVYEQTKDQQPKRINYFPGFPGYEKLGLTWNEARQMNDLLQSFFPVLFKAVKRDPMAKLQVDAMKKIVNMQSFKLGLHDIEKFLQVNGADASRSRAFAIRGWMHIIANYVTPKWTDAESILDGTVELLPGYLERGRSPEQLETIIKKNSTLESLAIAVYRSELAKEGVHISDRQLRSDLKECKSWKPSKGEPVVPLHINTFNKLGECMKSEDILIGFSSNSWKEELRTRKYGTNRARHKKKPSTRK